MEVRVTVEPGDALRIAREARHEGFPAIIAAGGDGTINEVVNGLGDCGIPLGILPIGTMNVFAMELGIPLQSPERAWDIIESGHIREIDLPTANTEFFVQLAGVGLDAEVVQATTPETKKVLGPLGYVLSLVQASAKKPPELMVEVDGGGEKTGSFLLVGNGRYYGGQLAIFPEAELDDGVLDAVLFKNQTPWDVMRYFQAILFGSHPELPDVEYFQSSRIQVQGRGRIPFELDGELSGELPCTFSIHPSPLRIFAPPSKNL